MTQVYDVSEYYPPTKEPKAVVSSFRLSESFLCLIDKTIEMKLFTSRSECLQYCILHTLTSGNLSEIVKIWREKNG